ncbi:MAG: hypothetical protein RTU92_03410 [Candidatus Thorarchaeota archaeon]
MTSLEIINKERVRCPGCEVQLGIQGVIATKRCSRCGYTFSENAVEKLKDFMKRNLGLL